jgi:hypothetical protein
MELRLPERERQARTMARDPIVRDFARMTPADLVLWVEDTPPEEALSIMAHVLWSLLGTQPSRSKAGDP